MGNWSPYMVVDNPHNDVWVELGQISIFSMLLELDESIWILGLPDVPTPLPHRVWDGQFVFLYGFEQFSPYNFMS